MDEKDFDDIQDALETKALRAKGLSESDIQRHRETKAFREKISFYLYLEKSKSPAITPSEIAINLANNYEKIGHRALAIAALRRLQPKCSDDAAVELLLSKLLFRNNDKSEAEEVISGIVNRYKEEKTHCERSSDHIVALEDAADAFYILGWIKIHSDNHTEAYQIWTDGFINIPSDERLKRQFLKVLAWRDIKISKDHWDRVSFVNDTDLSMKRLSRFVKTGEDDEDKSESSHESSTSSAALINSVFKIDNDVGTTGSNSEYGQETRVSELVGQSYHSEGTFDVLTDFDMFAIPESNQDPALGLFNSQTQQRNLVFRTKNQVLTSDECAKVVKIVEECIENKNGGDWPTVRSASVKTTDIAVEDVPVLRLWLRCLLAQILQPMLATCYPMLADGSTFGCKGERLRVHDAFIVRYDADTDGSTHLPLHCDTSCVSFTVALNSGFEGGGTRFTSLETSSFDGVVEAHTGQALAFAGPLRHGGHLVTRGVRIILVLFMYAENFAYQEFLRIPPSLHVIKKIEENNENESNQEMVASSISPVSSPNSAVLSTDRQYVVYRETLELMTTLNRFPLDD